MRFLVGLVIGAVIGYVVAGRRELLTLVDYRRRAGSKDQDLTREQLYERAQAADIPGRSTMNKEELREAVEEADRSS
jgi:DNA end-binding protein Ku